MTRHECRQFHGASLRAVSCLTPPPDALAQGCVEANPSQGLPFGELYSIILQDAGFVRLAQSPQFTTGIAQMHWSSVAIEPTQLTLTASWDVTGSLASKEDVIKVYNSAGEIVAWWFTSCGCDTTSAAAAVGKGTKQIVLGKAGSKPGGYTFKYFPGGKDAVGGSDESWMNWAAYGW